MLLFFKNFLSSNKTSQDHLKVLKLTDIEACKTHKHWSSLRRSPHSTKAHRHWSSQHSQALKLYGGCRSSQHSQALKLYGGCRSSYSDEVRPLGFWSARKQYWEAHKH